MDFHGPWELLDCNWDSEGLLRCSSINLKVGKGESWGPGSSLREMYTVGVYWLFPPVLHVCLHSQPFAARRVGGRHVNKCIYYGISLVCVYSPLSCSSLLEPSVLHSDDAGLCQQSSVLASVLGAGVPDWCGDWWGCCPVSGSRYIALGQEKRLPLFFQTLWLQRYLIIQVLYDHKCVLAPQ